MQQHLHNVDGAETRTLWINLGCRDTAGGTMATMRVVQISRPNGPLEVVERQIPEPGPGSVRIKVQACGICHSDSVTKEGLFPGIPYPRVPGHEVAGVIDAVGPSVAAWAPGQKVGVGWNGGYCGYCDPCRRGEFFACVRGQTGGSYARRGRPRCPSRAWPIQGRVAARSNSYQGIGTHRMLAGRSQYL
jgi:hypothetical protein